MRGILLAGGSGTRLAPLTIAVSKQLLPCYNKPLIYYPLSTLLLAGLREVLVITTPGDEQSFRRLLGSGSQWGCAIDYAVQPRPGGIAQAWLIARDWLGGQPSCLALGDNLLYGAGLGDVLRESAFIADGGGAACLGCHVTDPSRYGVAEVGPDGVVTSLEEKPATPCSNLAVPGLYFVDGEAPAVASRLAPSSRGELEVVDVLRAYLPRLRLTTLSRGFAWLDCGTPEALLDAGNFVATLERRCGLPIGDPLSVAIANGWVRA